MVWKAKAAAVVAFLAILLLATAVEARRTSHAAAGRRRHLHQRHRQLLQGLPDRGSAPPLSVLCAAPSSCPDAAALTAAGIPNAACGNCTAFGPCFAESRQDQFLGAGTASSFLSLTSCTYAQTDGSVTDPVLSFLTFPRYPTLAGSPQTYPYLHLYFAANDTRAGDSVAVACYVDASLAVVDKYVVAQRVATATDNYKCLGCNPLSVLCAAPSSCPGAAALAAAGIPNAACGNCTAFGPCFAESRQDQFLGAGTASSFLSLTSCTYAQTDGSVTDPVLSFLTFPRYPTLTVGSPQPYPYLHLYFAANNTRAGDSVAVACYVDASLAVVDKYVVAQRVATATDNYKCLGCKWFWSYEVRVPASPRSCP
ncbi:hypothetical protein HXX76_008873 [Chlamydomonas incerta]|uniref:Uncharacterized protein n=1 Tax=Chlamydomonas incerta TaxID=51695 RepID=A0A835SYS8_CHLIN|nr:hypothetical protein HXX76_008873 [Chlamydomonas incerta]|eukprot:KAG2432528.1 hypothetical protein HXX76_008873 [Chlamydomonas incerta]